MELDDRVRLPVRRVMRGRGGAAGGATRAPPHPPAACHASPRTPSPGRTALSGVTPIARKRPACAGAPSQAGASRSIPSWCLTLVPHALPNPAWQAPFSSWTSWPPCTWASSPPAARASCSSCARAAARGGGGGGGGGGLTHAGQKQCAELAALHAAAAACVRTCRSASEAGGCYACHCPATLCV